jgi:hypothetical protein
MKNKRLSKARRKIMKKALSAILSLVMILLALTPLSFTAFAGDGGTTGKCTWEYSNGELTISGSGAMADYEYDSAKNTCHRPWESYTNEITKLTIKRGVTGIGSYAFYGFSNLAEIKTPTTVQRIGECSFAFCKKVSKIYIEGTSCVIEKSAFASCDETVMASINLYGVKTVGESAFYDCDTQYLYLDEAAERIESGAFSLNKSVTEIALPSSVKYIGESAFAACEKLRSITVPNPECVIADSSKTFDEKAEICGFIGSTAHKYAQKYNRAFSDISKGQCGTDANYSFDIKTGTLTVTGSGAVTRVDYYYADSIKKLVIKSGITQLEDICFYYLINLSEVVLPDGLTEIGEDAFGACNNLKSVTVPRSVTSIGSYAFGHDSQYKKIPDFVLKICCDTEKTAAQTYAEEKELSYEFVHTLDKGTLISQTSKTYTKQHICSICGEEITKTYNKKKNTLTVKAKKPSVKYNRLKKRNQTIARKKALSVSKAKGKVTYTKSKGNRKITVSKKTGKITVKKGLKKGTYKVKIKVKAAGTTTYKALTKTVTVTIKVR